MSLRAIASSRLVGNACVTKSLKFRPAVLRPVFTSAARLDHVQARARLQDVGEHKTEGERYERRADEPANRRRPIRPHVLSLSMPARPETSVANTSGAMIILMSRRKMSVMIEK